jgi:hypothetical protein
MQKTVKNPWTRHCGRWHDEHYISAISEIEHFNSLQSYMKFIIKILKVWLPIPDHFSILFDFLHFWRSDWVAAAGNEKQSWDSQFGENFTKICSLDGVTNITAREIGGFMVNFIEIDFSENKRFVLHRKLRWRGYWLLL